ncbi:hypothetical protein G3N95_09805 [Paraburkholderia sp. Tr-20389]|uniref:hypothetical protein n=1 Tax=Paraburkholderia sp. Tr-20389 TaxID=2703903 RepID=UPI001981E7FC|nr:hypothetical protein [Paraburkholderia sp. Tr-20389]MBN3753239.1 hypothetical protein [Paraburkholderia sp. Tr-20389]
MSPLSSLIDHSQLLNSVQTLYSFAPTEETFAADERVAAAKAIARDDERTAQIKSLVSGTLLFLPLLGVYFALCATR